MYKVIFLTILLSLLSACVPQNPAEIKYNHKSSSEDRSKKSLINRSANKTKNNNNSEQKITSRPIVNKDKDYDNTSGILHEKKPVALPKRANNDKVLPNAMLVRDQIIYHEVQPDETIEDIAQKYNKSVEEIAAFNQLGVPYEIDEAQIIKIKTAKLPSSNTSLDKKEITDKPQSSSLPLKGVEFDKPLVGKIIADFDGQNTNRKSNGINIAAQKGTKINSICNGKIVFSGAHPKFGNLIIVKADKSDIHIAYAHMEELIHKKGDEIKRGEAIGYVGSSGDVDMPQLYLAMKKGKTYVDPAKYIAFDN